jgi:membrane protease YdiL (CAAX protease family)
MASDDSREISLASVPLRFDPPDPVEDSATRKMLPQRYQIRTLEDDRALTCVEAANVAVVVRRGQSISSGAARKAAENSIFLDGYAQGEPFLDVQRRVYNLDHHEGCVRSFTLATCEQVLILLLKGLDLEVGRWTVYANEPDLDTVLAIWLLLNHRRIAEKDGRVRRRLTPLVRLQGVIDAHGLESQEFSGFPGPLRREMLERIERLRQPELELKRTGEWGTADGVDFVLSVLQLLDEMMYSPRDFEGMVHVDEITRVSLTDGRLAVACRSDLGIYEVEEHLRGIHGDRLGLVILETGEGRYTLRQSDPFLPVDLHQLYDRLNLVDPAAAGESRWGGSEEIGGSPRGVGSHLGLATIMETAAWVYRPKTLGERLRAVGAGVAAIAVALVGGALFANGGSVDGLHPGWLAAASAPSQVMFALVVGLVGLVLVSFGEHLHPGHFGVRRPRGARWLWLVPPILLGAAGGGLWFIRGGDAPTVAGTTPWDPVLVVLIAASAEILFRGAGHGAIVSAFRCMRCDGPWFLSVPTAVTAVAWAATNVWLLAPPTQVISFFGPGGEAVWISSLLLCGVLLGFLRERSGSVWVAVSAHAAGALALFGATVGGFL